MMRSATVLTLALAGGLWAATSVDDAKAQRWGTMDGCVGTVEGIGRGTGAFGRGTERARYAAARDWERNAYSQYGRSYSNLNRADDVQWDCKKNALLLAKCVVTANPCRSRMRG